MSGSELPGPAGHCGRLSSLIQRLLCWHSSHADDGFCSLGLRFSWGVFRSDLLEGSRPFSEALFGQNLGVPGRASPVAPASVSLSPHWGGHCLRVQPCPSPIWGSFSTPGNTSSIQELPQALRGFMKVLAPALRREEAPPAWTPQGGEELQHRALP